MTRLLFFIHKMVQALIEIGQYQSPMQAKYAGQARRERGQS